MKTNETIIQEYRNWNTIITESDLKAELSEMDSAAQEDAFYRDLVFGTGGLRGIIGAGTNQMNVHVVAKAGQGLFGGGQGTSVVIGYDSRIKSVLSLFQPIITNNLLILPESD